MKKQKNPAPKVGFVSLGCPKALVDSERILTQLRRDGYEIVPSYGAADVVVVNTCGFIDSAKEESLHAIGEAITENGRVIVTGCLGVKQEEIRAAHPGVLAVTGPHQYQAVVDAVHDFLPPPPAFNPFVDLVPQQGIKLTPSHYAYLKIAEGCNHKCSFCIIPSMRGPLQSRDVADVLAEAERLVNAGVKELLVISQDTSAYGADRKYRGASWKGEPVQTRLFDLCERLGEFAVWVRLHYVYPYPHVDEIIPLMAAGKILPYLDVPFQHGSPRILKLMRRPAATENTLQRIEHWRRICPELVLRSTFIVGFPGETESDFAALLQFLEAAELDRVGCFQYSPVAGAGANALPDPVPPQLAEERWHRFMERQAAISARKLRQRIGQTMEVLVDEVDAGRALARSAADAPEIDGNVIISQAEDLAPGDLVQVIIESADDYDLWGRPVAPVMLAGAG